MFEYLSADTLREYAARTGEVAAVAAVQGFEVGAYNAARLAVRFADRCLTEEARLRTSACCGTLSSPANTVIPSRKG